MMIIFFVITNKDKQENRIVRYFGYDQKGITYTHFSMNDNYNKGDTIWINNEPSTKNNK